MKPFRILRSCAAAMCIASAFLILATPSARAEESAPQPAAPSGVLLADLRGTAIPIYGYKSWEQRISRTPDGVLVLGAKGAEGDGGLCSDPSAPVDLSGMTYLEVAIAVGQNNEVPEVTVALNDADGTAATARIRIEQLMPGQPVWFRVPIAGLQAATGEHGGRVAGLDIAHVTQWQLQGDWVTKKPMQVLFIAVRARR